MELGGKGCAPGTREPHFQPNADVRVTSPERLGEGRGACILTMAVRKVSCPLERGRLLSDFLLQTLGCSLSYARTAACPSGVLITQRCSWSKVALPAGRLVAASNAARSAAFRFHTGVMVIGSIGNEPSVFLTDRTGVWFRAGLGSLGLGIVNPLLGLLDGFTMSNNATERGRTDQLFLISSF